ncbi:MAG: hypothetical protein IPM35_15055 [Myxococcales bacterium]|nr:hypothetical protein [Myxococcales bacterium]
MSARTTNATRVSEEIFIYKPGVSLCLLLNRRARTLRVVDFRSGPSPVKRALVLSTARKEGVERVFTLVERDECGAWARMGFAREGNIPGFYKRSDAFVLGALVGADEQYEENEQSGTRPALTESGDDVETDRAYQAARRCIKDVEALPALAVKLSQVKETDVAKPVAAAVRAGRALTGFEPFGRDVVRSYFQCTARGGQSLWASVETQTCFNNAFVELLTAPKTDKELALTSGAVRQICDELLKREMVGCFALSPADDPRFSAVFAVHGFRRTGVLRGHLAIGQRRVDAFLWSRKLAQPADS